MTEQPPIAPGATADPVEPKSLPENLAEVAEALPPPNLIEERERGRTDMIVWSLMGLVLIGGVITMVLSWRDVALPGLSAPSFETPEIAWPWESGGGPSPLSLPAEGNSDAADPAPEGMTASTGDEAQPVGRSDKPPAE